MFRKALQQHEVANAVRLVTFGHGPILPILAGISSIEDVRRLHCYAAHIVSQVLLQRPKLCNGIKFTRELLLPSGGVLSSGTEFAANLELAFVNFGCNIGPRTKADSAYPRFI